MVTKQAKLLGMPLLIAMLLMAWHTGLAVRTYLVSDTLFLAGLMLLLVGATEAVRNNGLFDIVGYSSRRFVELATNKPGEVKVDGFAQYLQRPRRKVDARLPLLGGAIYLLAAIAAAAVHW